MVAVLCTALRPPHPPRLPPRPARPDRPDHAPANPGDRSDEQLSTTSHEDVRARVDGLLTQMTPEEKAGQLTQYFYMGFMRDQAGDGAPSQPEMVEAAIATGVGPGPRCS